MRVVFTLDIEPKYLWPSEDRPKRITRKAVDDRLRFLLAETEPDETLHQVLHMYGFGPDTTITVTK